MAFSKPNTNAQQNPNANKKKDINHPSDNAVEETQNATPDEIEAKEVTERNPGNGNLPRFFDISDETSEHLDELGITPGEIVSFIANNIDNPSLIFNARHGTGITDEMLADILGEEISPENIQSYWEENGIIPGEEEVDDPEVDDPETDDTEGTGNGNLPRFFDISDETSDHLDELGITPGEIVSFIANNIDNPSLIFNARHGTGITDEMLADILGEEISPEDIQNYWEENGVLNSTTDVELLGVNSLEVDNFIDIA